jgi:hypothetical protein
MQIKMTIKYYSIKTAKNFKTMTSPGEGKDVK